jgi:protein-S-isoprenylcysteine O-methyltransferase Ste14
MVGRLAAALYSALAYVFFLGVFTYAIAFTEGLVVPKTIDSGPAGPLLPSLIIDTLLLGIFAVQHSVMARPGFKRVWTRIVPKTVERSTYVLLASLLLALLCWQWRPIPQTVWSVANPIGAGALYALSFAGFGLVLTSTYLINHFELFGLSQGFSGFRHRDPPDQSFVTPLFYRWIRHPLYTGFVIAFWAAAHMSLGHLVFAIATTGYIFIGIWFEERDLIAAFGERYRVYRSQVGMVFPKLGGRGRADRQLP